jgi:hypothetical protein
MLKMKVKEKIINYTLTEENKMFKTIIKKICFWSLNYLYNHIDKDKNGKIDKKELESFYLEIKDYYDYYKKFYSKKK